MDTTTLALILFLVTYALMIAFQDGRCWIAIGSACVYLLLGIMPVNEVISSIDWNVLLMLAGTMGSVALFVRSKMPNRLADLLLGKCPNLMWVAVAMSLFAGVVSAFMDNVATVLMIAPVALAVCKKQGVSPVPMLISISVSSNLQGAATLVGDTTSILLGGYAGINFMEFFVLDGRPGIFWAVELGALATVPVMLWLFRGSREPVTAGELTPVEDRVPSYLLIATVLLLILSSFLPDKPALTNGLICGGLCAVGLLRETLLKRELGAVKRTLREIDFATLALLAGLFVVIESIRQAGVIDRISEVIVLLGGGNVFRMYTLIVWGSVLFSAFVDNIPYVATMLPVVTGIANRMGIPPMLFYFGLLSGATLGGNLTPIGASANIAAIGILKRGGYEVGTKDFMRIGVPFTLVAVTVGYLFIWAFWH